VPRSWAGVAPATIVASRPCSTGREHEIGGEQHGHPHRQKPAVWLMRSESLPTGTPIASRQLWPKPRRLPSLGSVGPATMRRDFGSPRPRCGERSVRLPARRERAPNIARPRYGDQAMLAKLRPAVHDSMTDGGQSRHVGVGEELCDADDRFLLATYGCGLVDRLVSAEVLRGELSVLLADRLGLAGKRHFGPRRCHAVQTELERGRATVQREHVQIGSRVSRSTSRPRPRPCAHGVQRQSSTSGMSSPCSLM